MKRTLLLAAITCLGAGTAAAQSNITIYGRFNATVERQDNAGIKSTSLLNNSSRVGFKGTEDLGSGLKAGFQLEHGFNVDTGAATHGNAFWARQSEVNLGGRFGTLRLGNFTSEAYYATADYISMHNHDTGSSADALYAYIGRNTNKIAYRLPDFGALTLEGAVTLKEGAADHSYDLAANYAMGALQLGAGFEKLGSAKQFAIRANYETGPFVLAAYVQRDTDGFGPGLGSRTSVRLAGMYTFGVTELHLNLGRAGDYSKVANSDATQATVGVNHNLSKRTKVYGYYTKINASAATSYVGDFSSFALGVRHNF
jgi:predicted porin